MTIKMVTKIARNEDGALEETVNQNKAAAKINHHKVNPGEPGCNIVTELKDGLPILKNSPIAPAPSPSSLLPSNAQEQTEDKPVNLSKHDEIAYYRFALIKALWTEISQKPGIKKHKIIKQFLKAYNSGSLLPNIFESLKHVSRPTIYRWIKAYNEGDIKALVPQYRGPEASEITEYEKYILLNCLLHDNRLKIGTAIKFTKTFLTYKKIESPSSESKLRRFAEEFKRTHYDAWIYAREGSKALNDKCLPYNERNWRLLTVGEGLVADGHRLNFQVVNPFNGRPCRATIVLFWDWKSAYPLGWEIMIEEDVQCIASALRNAILTLGKIPKWLLIDNGKAFKSKVFTSKLEFEDGVLYGMFATLGIHTHFSQAYNPQEKPLERFWGTFNNWFERLMPSYTGASIEDKPAWMRRNEKDAQARHNKWVPKIEDVQELFHNWVEFYADQPSRGRDGKTPREIFEVEKGPGVDPSELYHLMMAKKEMKVHRNGVTFNGWHYYNEALYGINDYIVGKYSLSDFSKIYCFYKNEFRCVAEPINPVHPMASESECPKDLEAVKQNAALKNRVRRMTKNLLNLIETGNGIDWDRSLQRSPDIAEVITAIEDKKKPDKLASLYVEPAMEEMISPENLEEERRFDYAFERYEYLLKKDTLNDFEKQFIEDYRNGKIAPGEWESIYGLKRLDCDKP
jgi:putative transposase